MRQFFVHLCRFCILLMSLGIGGAHECFDCGMPLEENCSVIFSHLTYNEGEQFSSFVVIEGDL